MHARSTLAGASPVRLAPSRSLAVVAGAIGILLAVAIGLWAHYGSAVFYEMILNGIVACF